METMPNAGSFLSRGVAMKRMTLAALGVCLLLFAHQAVSQRDFSKVEFQTHHVAGNIYVLDSGAGGNIGLSIGDDGVLMIDDQFLPLAEKIRAATRKLTQGKLKFLINTHHHGDHTGANPAFGKDAPIVAHSNVRKRLAGQLSGPALPVITFNDSLTIHFNGEEIDVFHVPGGHTDGDSIIYFKGSNVVHMGDQFFAGRFPYVDVNSGGNPEGYRKNVAQVVERLPADVKVIPGHGPLSTLGDLKQFHGMLGETISHIRELRKSGKTLSQAKQAGLPDKWDSWSWGFISTERWIEIVYNSLEG